MFIAPSVVGSLVFSLVVNDGQEDSIADMVTITITAIATNNRVIAAASITDGNNQAATVGTELLNPLVATIMNSEGEFIAGQTINFKVVRGGGSVFAGAATSDATGIVRELWTLGTIAGLQKVEIRAVDSTGTAVVYATFEATGIADSPAEINVVSGENQTAPQLLTLPQPIRVVVTDSYDNRKSGAPVAFIVDNGGTVSSELVITNILGEAETMWTLGVAIGQQALNASINGLAVNIGATASQAPSSDATNIIISSGDSQTVQQHFNLTEPLRVEIVDTIGNPVSGIQVTFAPSAGSGYFVPTPVISDSQGLAEWDGYFHAAGQQIVTATAIGIGSVTFATDVTVSAHDYDGYYECGNFFDMLIENGEIGTVPANSVSPSGTLNEADGSITVTHWRSNYTGTISIDSLLQAVVVGNYIYYLGDSPITGSFSCNRLSVYPYPKP